MLTVVATEADATRIFTSEYKLQGLHCHKTSIIIKKKYIRYLNTYAHAQRNAWKDISQGIH